MTYFVKIGSNGILIDLQNITCVSTPVPEVVKKPIWGKIKNPRWVVEVSYKSGQSASLYGTEAGSWNSYQELTNKILEYQNSAPPASTLTTLPTNS